MDKRKIFDKGLKKVSAMQQMLDGDFPHITKDGKWLTNSNGHWTGGFWIGLLWLKSLYDNDPSVKGSAVQQTKKLAVRMTDNKTHDMGFIFGPSCILGNNIDGNTDLVEMALAGAHNMEDLLQEEIGLVLAWDEPGYEGIAIVDTIMNIPIMIWAAERENNKELYDKAVSIADNIMKHHIRNDHSIYHVVRWDPETYEIVERSTHQGYGPDTCWSRGQAWAIYGFANMYRYTSLGRYLEMSDNVAEYFWSHLDEGLHLPRWDFHFKNDKNEPLDAAAASIASSGMLLLSKMLEKDGQLGDAKLWKERAEKIIHSMAEHCLYRNIDLYGIIENVTVDKPRNSGVNESAMYGDYYFMEALYRLMHDENKSDLLEKLY